MNAGERTSKSTWKSWKECPSRASPHPGASPNSQYARETKDSWMVISPGPKTRGTSLAFPLSYFLSEFCKCNIYFRLSLNRPRTGCVVDNTQHLFSHSDKSQHGKQCDSPNITPVLPCNQMRSCFVAPRVWSTEQKSLGPQESLPLIFLLTQ